jgi:biofilm PGA synthesis N-glycosyltransferase PgaC
MDTLTQKRKKPSSKPTSAFTVLTLIVLAGVLAIVISQFGSTHSQTSLYGQWLLQAMSIYLVFIFFRTAVHLLLSFANLFFSRPKGPAQYQPLISVLIPCFNEELVVEKAIRSVLKSSYSNFEILIIDDGSKDRTLDVASGLERNGKVRVINQRNAGKAEALNRGVAEALGEYIFCMDADSVLSRETLELGLKHFQNSPRVAAVAGSVEIGNLSHVLTAFQRLEYISGLNLFKAAQSFLGCVTVIPGPVGLFKRSAVLEVGGYSASTYAEDCELTIRLLMAGYITVYEPLMVAVTEAPESIRDLVSQRYRWSRGVVQALKENARWLLMPIQFPRNFCIILYILVESIFIPIANFVFTFLSLEYALSHSSLDLCGEFFLQLMMLDVTLALFCVALENGSFKLLAASLLNRFTYGFAMEILRFFSIVDEVLGLPMSWAKLERKGLGE